MRIQAHSTGLESSQSATTSERNRSGYGIPKASKATTTSALVLGAVLACVVFVGVRGFAVALHTDTGDLAAGDTVVTPCGKDISLNYSTEFSPTLTAYTLNGVTVSKIPPRCLGKDISLTFTVSDKLTDTLTVNATLPSAGTRERIPIAPRTNPIGVNQIRDISVVIS